MQQICIELWACKYFEAFQDNVRNGDPLELYDFGQNSRIFLKKCDFRAVQTSALCRSRRELSNAYLLTKFGLDTAENEPCKVCPTEQCSRRARGGDRESSSGAGGAVPGRSQRRAQTASPRGPRAASPREAQSDSNIE